MDIAAGNVIRFTPDSSGWIAEFTAADLPEGWELPVIGWAVVAGQSVPDGEGESTETEIVPVVFDEETYATTLREYRESRADPAGLSWKIVRR